MKKIRLHLTMILCAFGVGMHRATKSDVVALANEGDGGAGTPGAAPADRRAAEAAEKERVRLADENARLKQQLAETKGALNRSGKDESAIRKKMALGLSREQAEAAVEHQAKYNERKSDQPKETFQKPKEKAKEAGEE
jgi:hypothetical protein